MTRWRAYGMAALLGYGGSILWVLLTRSVVASQGWGSTLLDVLMGLMGIAGWKLWEMQRRDFWIMIVELLGSAAGVRIALWVAQ